MSFSLNGHLSQRSDNFAVRFWQAQLGTCLPGFPYRTLRQRLSIGTAQHRSTTSSGMKPMKKAMLTSLVAFVTREETNELIGGTQANVSYLLSSMLLVEGLPLATGGESLQVAEIDLTNLPGLLVDDHAIAWRKIYNCYLERLQTLGIDAYASDPATCP